jgi:catechol 1,2-dioxygenase
MTGRRTFLGLCAAAAAWIKNAAEALAEAILKATPPNILGPYYRKGAPASARLHPADAKGTPLAISGRVTDTDGKPLAGAVVDVWQADPSGSYDNDDAKNPPPANHFRYRAVVKSDKDGKYAFDTLMPGSYEIGGGQVRPKHIHYMVTAAGHRQLITQLYFENDPFFEGDVAKNLRKDQFVKFRELVIPVKEAAAGKPDLQGTFDIVLAKA